MRRVSAAALAGLIAACAAEPAPEPPGAEPAPRMPSSAAPAGGDLARAQAAMADFAGRLRAELQAAMARGGPVGAVDFCHANAARIAAEVGDAHGLRLGRVAVPGRNRSPGNVAEGWLRQAVDDFQAAVDAGAAPEAQARIVADGLPEGVALRVARGIRVEPACLACHGEAIAPAIADALAARYPGDLATGFREGDLRGAIWAEVPATE